MGFFVARREPGSYRPERLPLRVFVSAEVVEALSAYLEGRERPTATSAAVEAALRAFLEAKGAPVAAPAD